MRTAVLLTRSLLFVSVVVLALSIGGFVTSQARNAVSVPSIPSFNSDSVSGFRAYGEVPIPGTQTLHLPAGPVAITFHAETVSIPQVGLPVPDLKLDVNPPAGRRSRRRATIKSSPMDRSPHLSAPGWRSGRSTSARPVHPARLAR
jgi:hypothetical protein